MDEEPGSEQRAAPRDPEADGTDDAEAPAASTTPDPGDETPAADPSQPADPAPAEGDWPTGVERPSAEWQAPEGFWAPAAGDPADAASADTEADDEWPTGVEPLGSDIVAPAGFWDPAVEPEPGAEPAPETVTDPGTPEPIAEAGEAASREPRYRSWAHRSWFARTEPPGADAAASDPESADDEADTAAPAGATDPQPADDVAEPADADTEIDAAADTAGATDAAGPEPSEPAMTAPTVVASATVAVALPAATRSPNPATCPFFRSIDATGDFAPPIEAADPANRCAALGEARPQSTSQQQLVCLTTAHGTCPRHLRGSVAIEPVAPAPVRRGPSVPVAVATLVLAGAAAASFAFVLVRGGLALPAGPGASPGASPVAIASPTASVTTAPTPAPTPVVTASPSPSPSPTPAPTPVVTPSPAPTPTPAPTSDRYAVLDPCPDAPNCWIYIVRAGDNFRSIVDWFGVPYDVVLEMNPQIGDPTTIHVGDQIRMPPPTR